MINSSEYLNAASKSKLGFGAMRLPGDYKSTAEMVDMFLDGGFNYFDTAWIYGGSEESLKKNLVKRHARDKFLIADKLPPWEVTNQKQSDKLFEAQLQRTGLDYFDFYLLHSIEDANEIMYEELDVFNWAMEKKKKGLVNHVGFSFHGTTAYLSRLLEKYPGMEFVQLQQNYNDNKRGMADECRQIAVKHNKPIIVMEPVRGGALAKLPASAEKILKEYAPERSIASWAIQYAATLQGVSCVLSGMSNMEQLKDNLKTFADLKPLTSSELKMLDEVLLETSKVSSIPCTACGYCLPNCPKEIKISSCFSLYNDLKRGGVDWNLKMMYSTLPDEQRAHDCVSCNACVSICPQKIDIPKELNIVADTFK